MEFLYRGLHGSTDNAGPENEKPLRTQQIKVTLIDTTGKMRDQHYETAGD